MRDAGVGCATGVNEVLANLKIRTGLLAVLSVLIVALIFSSVMGWVFARHADDGIDDLNRVAAEQARPLFETRAQLLRARLSLVAAYLDLATGTGKDAAAAIQQGETQLANARVSQQRFQDVPKSNDEAREMARRLEQAFNPYVASIQTLGDQLKAGSTSGYVVQAAAMRLADQAFDEQLTAFLTRTERRGAEINDASDERYVQAEATAIVLLILAVVLAFACWRFINRRVLAPLREAGEHFGRIAAGDLTRRVVVTSRNEIGQLFALLQTMQDSLARTVGEVRRSVTEINVGAAEIAAGNTNLSSRTEEQAASLEETAASMEQIASNVKQNTDSAQQANRLAAQSSGVARQGGDVIGEVVGSMSRISESSARIADIVSVIDSIAFQTNILALNAAVEAARAGEQGKGFAVVAGEVRSLAQRSAQAAKEVRDLIEASRGDVQGGVEQVRRAGETMQSIVTSVQQVSDIMGEISSASAEQLQGIEQINGAVAQMDDVTQQNAALVEEAAAAAASLEEQAKRLADTMAFFKVGSDQVIEMPSGGALSARAPVLLHA